jgi:hypothetical protein
VQKVQRDLNGWLHFTTNLPLPLGEELQNGLKLVNVLILIPSLSSSIMESKKSPYGSNLRQKKQFRGNRRLKMASHLD